MFCKYCGKELDEHAAFCPNCGAKNDTVGETAARATVNETAAANHSAPSDDKGKANKLGISGIRCFACFARAGVLLRDSVDSRACAERGRVRYA